MCRQNCLKVNGRGASKNERFRARADFNPSFTRHKIEELISYGHMDKYLDDYGRLTRKGFKCSTIQTICPDYCLKENCPIFKARTRG